MKTISSNICFGGVQHVCEHDSMQTGTPMRFAVYIPNSIPNSTPTSPMPVIWWLSGLTCTEQNFIGKSGVQKYAAEQGVCIIAPDTSPRGAGVLGEDDDYDFGTGAGFYVDATIAPWNKNYRMFSYISEELPQVVGANFAAADMSRQSIMGHSMGGHGALIIALKNPGRFMAVSAFSPICNPTDCAWGQKAFRGYLGDDVKTWRQWDASALIEDGHTCAPIVIEQGGADEFLEKGQLRPQVLENVCGKSAQALTLNMRDGYDHSYYFISSFMGEHIAGHAKALKA